jgi:hypothetical protein
MQCIGIIPRVLGAVTLASIFTQGAGLEIEMSFRAAIFGEEAVGLMKEEWTNEPLDGGFDGS